jgi:serine O-acetyltransferase
MIKTKSDLKEYLKADAEVNGMRSFFKRYTSVQWQYIKRLRYTAYYINRKSFLPPPLSKLLVYYSRYRLQRLGLKTGYTIGPNTFGKGLLIPHTGTIVVNGTARYGSYCVLQCGVNISENAKGGDHIYFGTGSKIMRDTYIADDVIIGANAVVTKDVITPNIVVGGIPACKISDNGYKGRTIV